MRYLGIEGIALDASCIGLGASHATPERAEEFFALAELFVAAGGNLIDTAHTYGGGAADSALGMWLATRDRSKILVLGKGCHPAADGVPRVTPAALEADLTESLERLQTSWIDLYVLHRDDPSTPVEPIVDALNAELDRGRIHAFGASNWSFARIEEANAYARRAGLVPFAVNNPGFSLALANEPMWANCVYADAALIADHERTGLPLIAFSAQANGFFSGRYAPGAIANADVARVYGSDGNFARLRRAQQLAAAKGVSSNEIALSYVLSQRFPTVALISARTPEQLTASLRAADLVLTPAEVAWLVGAAG